MRFRKDTWTEKTIFRVHKILWKSRLTFRKIARYNPLSDEAITVKWGVWNGRESKRFLKRYVEVENKAVPKEIESRSIVLDIGSGGGRLVRLVNEKVERIIAIDIDPASIEALRSKFGVYSNVDTIEADAKHIPLEDKSIDTSVVMGNTFGLFYNVKDAELGSYQTEVLKELMRVTRRRIVMTMHSRNFLWESLRYYRMNNLEASALNEGRVILRGENGDGVSQKFSIGDVDEIMMKTGIENYEIISLNKYVWMLRIKLGDLE